MSFFHMLAGTISSGGDTVEVQTVTVFGQALTAGVSTTATASIRFNSDGTVDYTRLNTGNTIGAYDWIVPADNAGDYEVRAVLVSGPSGGGSAIGQTTGSWHSLASNVLFGVSLTGVDAVSDYVLDIEISKDSGTTIAASNRVTLRAEVVNLGGA